MPHSISGIRLCSFILIASIVLGGCFTHLGYVPYDVYAPRFRSSCADQQKAPPCGPPSYTEVRNWASDVADGYDTRATLNRQAVYGGALLAAAATASLAGLAAFNTSNNAIISLPIGTTFVAGAMAAYNNEKKAVIYGSASQTIRDLLIQSDCRETWSDHDEKTDTVCLHAEVSTLMRRVNDHITALDPQNVVDSLKAVASSAQTKRQKADSAKQQAAQAEDELRRHPGNDAKKKATDKENEADQANNDANKEENKLVSLSRAGNDFTDVTKVPEIGRICTKLPNDCELTERTSPAPTPSPTAAQ